MNVLFSGGGGCECLWVWVKMFVKLSLYSMVNPSTCSFVIIHSFVYVSVRLSVYQFEYCLSMFSSVRPCAFFVIVYYSIGLYVLFPSIRPSDRLSVLSSSVSMNARL